MEFPYNECTKKNGIYKINIIPHLPCLPFILSTCFAKPDSCLCFLKPVFFGLEAIFAINQ